MQFHEKKINQIEDKISLTRYDDSFNKSRKLTRLVCVVIFTDNLTSKPRSLVTLRQNILKLILREPLVIFLTNIPLLSSKYN